MGEYSISTKNKKKEIKDDRIVLLFLKFCCWFHTMALDISIWSLVVASWMLLELKFSIKKVIKFFLLL